MDTALGIAVIALAKKFLDLVRYIMNIIDPPFPAMRKRAIRSAVTLLSGWVVGILVIIFAVHTSFASLADGLFGVSLTGANLWTQIMLGLVVGSSTGVIADFTRALDNTQSAQEPDLIPALADTPAAEEPPAVEPPAVEEPSGT